MKRGSLDDLHAFATVARERSFTRAAAELGLSTSALSYQVKRLEQRLAVRLLQRNSRSVAPTAAGQQLLDTLSPALDDIGEALDELDRRRDRVSGTVRITATRQGYESVIRPVLAEFNAAYPHAAIEVLIDYAFRDVIADRLDAGIRIGEKLEQDMVAIRVGGNLRMVVVGSPAYLGTHPAPVTPVDLAQHACIGYRMHAAARLTSWEFARDGRQLEVHVKGPLVVNEPEMACNAALDGLALAYVMESLAAPFIADGRLVPLLTDWTPSFPGFFLYYSSRRQVPPTLAALIALLRQQQDPPSVQT